VPGGSAQVRSAMSESRSERPRTAPPAAAVPGTTDTPLCARRTPRRTAHLAMPSVRRRLCCTCTARAGLELRSDRREGAPEPEGGGEVQPAVLGGPEQGGRDEPEAIATARAWRLAALVAARCSGAWLSSSSLGVTCSEDPRSAASHTAAPCSAAAAKRGRRLPAQHLRARPRPLPASPRWRLQRRASHSCSALDAGCCLLRSSSLGCCSAALGRCCYMQLLARRLLGRAPRSAALRSAAAAASTAAPRSAAAAPRLACTAARSLGYSAAPHPAAPDAAAAAAPRPPSLGGCGLTFNPETRED